MTQSQFLEEVRNAYIDDDAEEIPSEPESTVELDSDIEHVTGESQNQDIVLSDSEDSEYEIPLSRLRELLTPSNLPIGQPPVWGKIEKPLPPSTFASVTGVPDFIKQLDNPTPYELFQFFLRMNSLLFWFSKPIYMLNNYKPPKETHIKVRMNRK